MVHFWRRFSKLVISTVSTGHTRQLAAVGELVVCLSLLKSRKLTVSVNNKIHLPCTP